MASYALAYNGTSVASLKIRCKFLVNDSFDFRVYYFSSLIHHFLCDGVEHYLFQILTLPCLMFVIPFILIVNVIAIFSTLKNVTSLHVKHHMRTKFHSSKAFNVERRYSRELRWFSAREHENDTQFSFFFLSFALKRKWISSHVTLRSSRTQFEVNVQATRCCNYIDTWIRPASAHRMMHMTYLICMCAVLCRQNAYIQK